MNRVKLSGWIPIFVFLILLLGWQLVHLTTEWLWFKEVGYTQVFTISLLAQGKAGLILGGIFFLLLYINLTLAVRLSRTSRPWLAHTLVLEEKKLTKWIRYTSLFLGLLAVFAGTNSAQSLLLFSHGLPFKIYDPLLNRDVSFYTFTLPFLRHLYGYTIAGLIFSFMGSIIVYLMRGTVALTNRFQLEIEPAARHHLLSVGIFFFLVLSFGYWLDLGDLPFAHRGVVYGAGYAEATTQTWVLKALITICLITSLVIIYAIFRRDLRPVAFIILFLVFSHIVGRNIYPALVQRFVVIPNEIALESPYLKHNIHFTRLAYGLDRIEEREFPALENLTLKDIQKNGPTIKNIRLWDYTPLLQTFSQLQEIRTYYKFLGVDNDRYHIGGEYRQVMLAPRELSYSALPSRTWVNEHLTYTHGYGIVMGPVNRVTKEGLPEFFIKDIPPVSVIDLKVTRPEIYFGEIESDYVFVKTKRPEFDYPVGEKNVYTRYMGEGGVPLNFWRKILFTARFKSLMILLSDDITSESRIMYYRNVRERVQKVAPFAILDGDPYLVVTADGRLVWILDGYTVTDRFPYSEPTPRLGNYIRNSLKATVDAYDGKIKLYISDPSDPMINTYARIYPGMLRSLSEMPADLRKHLRYPPGFLSVQARMYRIYHMRDPQVFYNKEDIWTIPHLSQGGAEQEMRPYYTIMKLPEGEKEEYILLLPFTPAKKDNMSAWLAARCDDPHYGKLIVYTFPKQRLVYGPRQIAARINQDAYISQQLSLWNQRGSRAIMGNLLAIPIEQSIIYVQPIFLASERGQLPELKRIILAYGNSIVMEENLELAINRLFGQAAIAPPKPSGEETISRPVRRLTVKDALNHWREAQKHLREGNWSLFGEEIKKMENVLKELAKESP
ncbi:MAG: UPF0182 family protein [Syntrophales bacterium]|nr:UPF0182 family protein [Syntrophales bacterium]